MKKLYLLTLISLLLLLVSSCSSTLILSEGEYMLSKNSVSVDDPKVNEMVVLSNYLYPVPNAKFMDIFSIKTSLYANYILYTQVNKDSLLKDHKVRRKISHYVDDQFAPYKKQYQKFKKWLGLSLGEAPILLDTNEISHSENQVKGALKTVGYFDATVKHKIIYAKQEVKKAQVLYEVTCNEPYFIREINYDIAIPEYKRIIVQNADEALVTVGMQYNEESINAEITRITNLIRNKGYYYVNKSIIYCIIDTINSKQNLDKNHHPTIAIEFHFQLPDNNVTRNQYLRKYIYNNTIFYTNYNPNLPPNTPMKITPFYNRRAKNDATFYFFITPSFKNGKDSTKIYRDYNYRTLADANFSKKNELYSQDVISESKKRLNALKNFSYIDINYIEVPELLDTVNNIGYLNTEYKLTRRKVNAIGGQIDARTDKVRISANYSNKNIFRGAEYLNINLYGGYVYYSLLNKDYIGAHYPEAGGNISLEFPRLFLLKRIKINALRYSTSIRFGIEYSGLYNQWMYNTGLTYNWQPNHLVSETFTPIDISTITTYNRQTIVGINDTSETYVGNNYFDIRKYPLSYRQKFENFFLLSLKYNINYIIPSNNKKSKMRFSLFYESSGMALRALDELLQFDKIGKYKYTTYQSLEFVFQHYYTINRNNSTAFRLDIGTAIPLFSDSKNQSVIPFDRGFYLGGSNSMRAFTYRSVAPGSYSGNDSLQYSGDIKFELNFEYRGTIYRSFKYGLFTDIGNIWLSNKHDDMKNAEINRTNWFKPAVCVGVGLRLDFSFFIIRLDYAVPILNPSMSDEYGLYINKRWVEGEKSLRKWKWGEGFKFAIGHAF